MLTFGALQDPLEQHGVLGDALRDQQYALGDAQPPHDRAAHLLLQGNESVRTRPAEALLTQCDTVLGTTVGAHAARHYLHEGLKTLVLGVKVFEVVDRLVVLPTELAVRLLQALSVLPGKLHRREQKSGRISGAKSVAPFCTQLRVCRTQGTSS